MMVIGGASMDKKLSKEIPTQGGHSTTEQYIISFGVKI